MDHWVPRSEFERMEHEVLRQIAEVRKATVNGDDTVVDLAQRIDRDVKNLREWRYDHISQHEIQAAEDRGRMEAWNTIGNRFRATVIIAGAILAAIEIGVRLLL